MQSFSDMQTPDDLFHAWTDLVSHPYIPPALLQIFPFSFPILLIHASKFLFSILPL